MNRIHLQLFLFVASSGLLLSGCGEPPQIVVAVPSGVEVREVPPPQKEGEGPAALGESNTAQAKELQRQASEAAVKSAKQFDLEQYKGQGLKVETVAEGSGEGAKSGQTITVHYTGTLENGKQFDSSRGKSPFTVVLGAGQVIKGWDAGLQGMKVGEKRKLTIPAAMGYGSTGQGQIPPNSTLLFDVEMIAIK
ncbi:MAG: FKBP-type peptidyl-prolyl cis-trans isomerase [bacterium]